MSASSRNLDRAHHDRASDSETSVAGRRAFLSQGLTTAVLGAATATAAVGCTRLTPEPSSLAIATSWTPEEIAVLPAQLSAPESPIRWVRSDTGDRFLQQLVERRADSLDMVLGGSEQLHEALARRGLVERIPPSTASDQDWSIARRTPLGFLARLAALKQLGVEEADVAKVWASPEGWNLTIGLDPRADGPTYAHALAVLQRGEWLAGYAELVRAAGNSRRIASTRQQSESELTRGVATIGITTQSRASGLSEISPALTFIPFPTSEIVNWIEGISVVLGTPRRVNAEQWARTLMGLTPASATDSSLKDPPPAPMSGSAHELLRDLLGAVLVESHEELRRGWESVIRAGRPRQPEAWLTEPPPWPPASVRRLIDDPQREAWVLTLAEQIVPDDRAQVWLLSNWERSNRVVDGSLLNELSEAVDGRLVREPRFRSWLRGEWTAWARQRYRRVARLLESSAPSDAGGTPTPETTGGPRAALQEPLSRSPG